jgi:starch-binding outer membrane protein, SusD/RagB family
MMMTRYIQSIFMYIACLLLIIVQAGCSKLVEPSSPEVKIGADKVYATNNSAASVLTRLFADLELVSEGTQGIPLIACLSADDFKAVGQLDAYFQLVYTNKLKTPGTLWWSYFYKEIYTANDVLESLPLSTGVTEPVKKHLLGEAKFVRAFCFFYMVNLFGDVPLTTTTNYTVNMAMGRTPSPEIYKQIITDLKDAKELLSADYLAANIQAVTPDRFRPTKAAASALLARAYLYNGEYANAETEATTVINKPAYGFVDLNNVFLKNSKEAIWQLPAMVPTFNTVDGNYLVLPGAPTATNPLTTSSFLDNAFEPGDLRNSKWVGMAAGYRFANKYKVGALSQPITESIMMLRLGEQYLIRAEARIQQDKIADGIGDLNVLRTRARGSNPGDLPDLSLSMPKATALLAVEHERQVELFAEWGHRWFDLKRTNRLDAVMTTVAPAKGSTWEPFRKLFPIPPSEILATPALFGHQNPGYD